MSDSVVPNESAEEVIFFKKPYRVVLASESLVSPTDSSRASTTVSDSMRASWNSVPSMPAESRMFWVAERLVMVLPAASAVLVMRGLSQPWRRRLRFPIRELL